jgi:hypothetical protein
MALAIAGAPSMAVENAIGRSLPGVWVQPQGGVVPTKPGFTFTVMPIGYTGSFSGGRQGRAILSGELVFDVSANLFLNVLIPQIVYKTELPNVSFSSSFYLPVDRRRVAAARVGNVFRRAIRSLAGWLTFGSRLTVGIHFSENNNLAIDTKIFAPTGAFKVGNLSNLGMNAWTIQPNVAHTYSEEARP